MDQLTLMTAACTAVTSDIVIATKVQLVKMLLFPQVSTAVSLVVLWAVTITVFRIVTAVCFRFTSYNEMVITKMWRIF